MTNREEVVSAYLEARVGDVVDLNGEWREVTHVLQHHVSCTATIECGSPMEALYKAEVVRRLTPVAADEWKTANG